MTTLGLVSRPKFKAGIEQARRILDFLEGKGISVRVLPHLAKALKRPKLASELEDMHVDFIVTLGGDGTVLFAASRVPHEVPLLPINLHSFGFLSECEIDEAITLLDQTLKGGFHIQETLRLSTRYKGKQAPDAANEVSLFPTDHGRPIPIQVQIGESDWFEFRGDGFVVATPLGSTGHALSLGGPILDSQLDAIALIPAAPLRHGFLPLIVPGLTRVTVQISKDARLSIDGISLANIPASTPLTICKSERPLRIIRQPSGFYSRLQKKLFRD